jgi:hypothetical protein
MGDSVEEKKRRKNERVKQRYAEDSEFREKRKASSRACQRKNKDAVNARQRHRYATNPEFREAKRAKRSGMSSEEYATRLADQGGLCVICLKAREKPLRIDHDHKTKKLRSLLCDPCNLGLGHFGDDSAALRRGGDYVDYWQWRYANPDDTGPPPFPLSSLHRLFDPSLPSTSLPSISLPSTSLPSTSLPSISLPSISLPSIQSPPLTGEDMTTTDDTTDIRRAEGPRGC